MDMPTDMGTLEALPSLDALVANRDNVIANWNLGPVHATVDPEANGDYWAKMGEIWQVDASEARHRLCANCEYYDNSAAMQALMDAVPLDAFDKDGGGRGFCTKFDFICHNLRTCQAWEDCCAPEGDDMGEKSRTASMQHKSLSLNLKAAPGEDGVFEGYASVFGVVDQGLDVVERGAFSKSLTTRKPKMLWQHDTAQPIGVWEEVREDERGLFVKGRILTDIAQGREALALLKAGAIDSMSIGYRTIESANDGSRNVRKLLQVELYEISLVTFPMLPDAKVTDVKSIASEREFERFLRDAGYSKSEATAITLHGFKGLTKRRDSSEEKAKPEGLDALIAKISKLKDSLHVG